MIFELELLIAMAAAWRRARVLIFFSLAWITCWMLPPLFVRGAAYKSGQSLTKSADNVLKIGLYV